jgi:hypothetical protein
MAYHVLIPRSIYILEPKRYHTVAIRLSYTTIYTSFIYYCRFLGINYPILTAVPSSHFVHFLLKPVPQRLQEHTIKLRLG